MGWMGLTGGTLYISGFDEWYTIYIYVGCMVHYQYHPTIDTALQPTPPTTITITITTHFLSIYDLLLCLFPMLRFRGRTIETQKIDRTNEKCEQASEKTPENKSRDKKNASSKNKRRIQEVLLLFALSVMVRIYRIERGGFVLWDEAHFGKFATHYLKREFFFDVHPPLGKLLTSLSGYIYRAAPEFPFNSEDPYPLGVDYGGMRVFHAIFGSFVPLFAYLITAAMGCRKRTSFAICLSLIFDNALVSISRLILLDPFLLFFVFLSEVFLSRVMMESRRMERLSADLMGLGVSIGMAASVKWIGFLTVAHVGVFATYCLLSEIRKRRKEAVFLFARLSVSLILTPFCVYILFFALHFKILEKAGPGDGEMSSRFQTRLKNSEILMNRRDLEYGNKVTLRNSVAGTGLLHSHKDRYPDGGPQQVTTYPHKDGNNYWKILKAGDNPEKVRKNEDLVFYHIETDTYMGVEEDEGKGKRDARKRSAAFSKEEMGGAVLEKTVFTLEPYRSSEIEPVVTRFYIKNRTYGCYLSYSGKKLPKWGFGQGEVVCLPEKTRGSLWNVELNVSEEAHAVGRPSGSAGTAAPLYSPLAPSSRFLSFFPKTFGNFFSDFTELNLAMNAANSSLVDDGNDTFGTLPLQWLFPKKWLKLNRWDGTVPRFAMVGNPLTWYLGTLNMLSLIVLLFLHLAKKPNGSSKYATKRGAQLYLVLGGWLFHYVPFFFVSRILYLHHYLPSLIFSVIGLCVVIDRSRKAALVLSVLSLISFVYFSPMTYGHLGGLSSIPGYRMFSGWNIYAES